MACMNGERPSIDDIDQIDEKSKKNGEKQLEPMYLSSNIDFYGFAIYLISFVLFAMFVIWAYFSHYVFDPIGLTYYPDRLVTYKLYPMIDSGQYL